VQPQRQPAQRIAHDGLTLPEIGFGTWRLRGAAGARSVTSAIDAGYTLIDSAIIYENEGAIGHAARSAETPRADLIVTSKLPGSHHAYDRALTAIEESVFRTGLEYIDVYLIHWPDPEQDLYVEAWQALIEAKHRGIVRAIGVSNFHPEQLDRLRTETGVLPEVNQIELHPYYPRQAAVNYHAQHGILTQGWSPLGEGGELLSDPVITRLAQAHRASPAQVVLAWSIAQGVIPLPKASTERRQRENFESTQLILENEEVAEITALERPDGRLTAQP
jgi:diketogulonate reductase-like aldo/keto reductase